VGVLRIAAWVALVAAWPGAIAAQPAPQPSAGDLRRAREDFDRGRAAFEAGEFDTALRAFESSYLITGSVEILYNIAVCHDRLRHDAEALAAYRNYLRQVPNAADRPNVEARIATLAEAEAGRLREEQAARERANAVATPEEAAAGAAGGDAGLRDGGTDDGGGIAGKWWFWTGVVGVVALGVVAGVLLFGGGEAPWVEGDDGEVHATLRFEGP
jgi:tetratricopeptide (TPR) repeat protein